MLTIVLRCTEGSKQIFEAPTTESRGRHCHCVSTYALKRCTNSVYVGDNAAALHRSDAMNSEWGTERVVERAYVKRAIFHNSSTWSNAVRSMLERKLPLHLQIHSESHSHAQHSLAVKNVFDVPQDQVKVEAVLEAATRCQCTILTMCSTTLRGVSVSVA